MFKLEFTVPGEPHTKLRARHGKGFTFQPKANLTNEDTVRTYALREMREAGQEAPHEGPLTMVVNFWFQPPKSWPRWKTDLVDESRIAHTAKPDIDNLLKLVKDALNTIVWLDDAQVVRVYASKHYSMAMPCTRVTIEEWRGSCPESRPITVYPSQIKRKPQETA